MKCSCLFWLQCGGWVLISCYSAVWTFVTSCLVSASQYKTDRTDDWFPKNFIIEIGREKVINLKKFFPTKCFYWYICLNLSDSLWSLTPGRWRLSLVCILYLQNLRLSTIPRAAGVDNQIGRVILGSDKEKIYLSNCLNVFVRRLVLDH